MPSTGLSGFTRDPWSVPDLGDRLRASTAPGGLTDTPEGRAWSAMHDPCMEAGLYTWQLPLQQRSAPRSVSRATPLTLFSMYGYLDLGGHPRVMAASQDAIDRFGTHPAGARMLSGTLDLHLELEDEIASFYGVEASTTFVSGFDANVAALSALLGEGDLVVMDAHAHRSLGDGARLSGAEIQKFPHNDLDVLESLLKAASGRGGRTLVVVDGVYSMGGDVAPLPEIVELKERYGAFLLVDEAHAMGTLGPTGRGTWELQGVEASRIDVITGSLAKAIPSVGGFVAGSYALRAQMQHAAAMYFFSSATAPSTAAAALEGIRVSLEEPEHRERMHRNADAVRAGLAARGFDASQSVGPIVPLLLGDEGRAFTWARDMLLAGVAVSAIPYPAVPAGQSRIRLCATGGHTQEHVDQLLSVIDACLAAEQERAPAAA